MASDSELLADFNSMILDCWGPNSPGPKRMIVGTDIGPVEFGEGIDLNQQDQAALDRALDISLGPAEPKES